jgi:cobalt transporter subunit CbtB
MRSATNLSGVTGIGDNKMNNEPRAIAANPAKSTSSVTWLSIVAAGLLGLSIITIAGHVQAATLHDAAHDVRHATGFPCH